MKNHMMAIVKCCAIASALTFVFGCAKESATSPASLNELVQNVRSPVTPSSCQVSKTDGTDIEPGIAVVDVNLAGEGFGQGTLKIYGQGMFPNFLENAFQDGVHAEPSRMQLLAGAVAWAWMIEPKRDNTGNSTALTLYKKIVYQGDGFGYSIDQSEVSYGEVFSRKDLETGLTIDCALPPK